MALSRSLVLVGILAFAFSVVQCEKLPSYIKPCPKTSNLTGCLIENINAALPHVIDGQTDILPSVNPYKVPSAVVKLDWLDLKMTEIEYPLLEGLRIKELTFDLEKGDLSVTVHASKLAGYGAYSVDGIMFGMNLNTTGFMYGNIASFIKPCPKTSNITSCLIGNIMYAILHIKNGQTEITPSFDPISLPTARMDKEWLTLILKNVEYPLFQDVDVKRLNVDLDEGTISLTIYAGKLSGYGHYTVNGTLFGMELDSSGIVIGILAGLELSIEMKGDYQVKNGRRHLVLEKTGFRQQCQSGFVYWTNLYPGEPYRTLRANHVMNQNILKVVDEIDLMVENIFGGFIFNGFKRFFELYAVDDVFTD